MFIGRRPDGSIYGSWTTRQADDADHPGQEEVADNHPDLIEFQQAQAARRKGSGADAMLARQRDEAVSALDTAIVSLPPAQQPAFRLIQQLLKE